ncbi:MAG: DNA replication/repair protein RecF [Longimicrobiales bacterium]|jgi:DNA replication and repair protein RecF
MVRRQIVRFAYVFRDPPKSRAVRLSTLALRHFRNLHSQHLEIPLEGVALIGDNAQGKSNFLEAIYYLETFRSFRGARDERMVGFDAEVFRLVGTTESDEIDGGHRTEIAAAFQKKGKRKKISIDGSEPDRMSDALGRLSAVIFSPSDIELISGGPSERRRFLDILLSLNEPGYLSSLTDYRKVLRRRNASLKSGAAGSVVAAWDQGLINTGARVMLERTTWISARCVAFGDYYQRVSDDARARMTYRPNVTLPDVPTLEMIAGVFREALDASADRERRMGVTVVGPHRDDMRLQLEDDRDGLDFRDYGSGGQRRTAALALRLVEAMTIRERRSQRPLILLDDVFAELDGGRSERILDLMEAEDTGQVVLTAPKDADVRMRKDALPRWRIRAGEIST